MFNNYKIRNLLLFYQSFSPERLMILKNTSWLFADRILRMGVGLIVGVWVARYLGAKQYGLFSYASAFVALFTPFATLGLDAIVIRYLVRDASCKDEVLGTAFWLKLFGSIVSLLITVGAVCLMRPGDRLATYLVAIMAATLIFQAFDTIDFWFQSQVESKYTVFAKNTAFLLVAGARIILIQIHAPLVAFAWAAMAEMGLGAVGLMIAYQIKGHSIKLWGWSLSITKALLQESWPLIFSGLSIMIYMKIDLLMLAEMVGDQAVGIYSAASRISEIWYFIPMAIVSSVSPSIYAAKEISEDLYYQRLKQLLRLMVVLSSIIAIPMTFLSGTIIMLLFGKSYADATSILSIHIWSSIFVFMGVATSPWFIAERLAHLSLRRTLAGAIVNIVLNLVLIPTYHGVGAAISTVISYAISAFIANIIDERTKKIFLLQLKAILFIS